MKSLIESSPDPIFAKDHEGRYIVMNEAGARLTRVTVADMLGHTDEELFDDAVAHSYLATDAEVRVRGTVSFEETLASVDGREHHILTHKAPWRDASGAVIGIVGLGRDVTDAKDAADELVRQRNLLQTIIDSVSGNIFAKDLEGRYRAINAAGAQKNGYQAAQMIGKTNFELLPRTQAEDYQKSDDWVLSTGQTVEEEERVVAGGLERFFLIRKSLWRDEQGRTLGVIGVSNDITDRVHAQKRIESLLHEKEIVLREVHHRIKNNMATVAGLLTLQARNPATPPWCPLCTTPGTG